MSAWAEAVWVKNFIDTINTTVSNISTTVSSIRDNTQLLENQNYGLSAIVNNPTYGLFAIANSVQQKNIILTTNSGTEENPIPEGVLDSNIANGALFFIKTEDPSEIEEMG